MGWARYAHSMRVFVFNSGLFFLRPTPAALELLEKVADRVETEGGWDQAVFNEAIFFPSSPRNEVCWVVGVGWWGVVSGWWVLGLCWVCVAADLKCGWRPTLYRPGSAPTAATHTLNRPAPTHTELTPPTHHPFTAPRTRP